MKPSDWRSSDKELPKIDEPVLLYSDTRHEYAVGACYEGRGNEPYRWCIFEPRTRTTAPITYYHWWTPIVAPRIE